MQELCLLAPLILCGIFMLLQSMVLHDPLEGVGRSSPLAEGSMLGLFYWPQMLDKELLKPITPWRNRDTFCWLWTSILKLGIFLQWYRVLTCMYDCEMFYHYCVCLKCWGDNEVLQNYLFYQFRLLGISLRLLMSCISNRSKVMMFSSLFKDWELTKYRVEGTYWFLCLKALETLKYIRLYQLRMWLISGWTKRRKGQALSNTFRTVSHCWGLQYKLLKHQSVEDILFFSGSELNGLPWPICVAQKPVRHFPPSLPTLVWNCSCHKSFTTLLRWFLHSQSLRQTQWVKKKKQNNL